MVERADEACDKGQRSIVKRKRFLFPAVFVLLAACIILGYWYLHLRGYISTNNAYVQSDPVTVSSKVLGRVTRLAVQEGDTTRQGELLVTLDDSDLRAQEAQSQASLEYSQRNVALAGINLDRARDDFNRASMQFTDNVITREQYDHARQALQAAEAQQKVAQSQVATSRAQLGVVQTQLYNMRILAPVSAVVARKWVMPGDIVQPGQSIYTLYDLTDLWITANFEETKLQSVGVGDTVEIYVDAFPGVKFGGRVLLIGAAAASQFALIPANNASGNFTKVTQRVPVRISIEPEASGRKPGRVPLLPGMSTEVRIRVGSGSEQR